MFTRGKVPFCIGRPSTLGSGSSAFKTRVIPQAQAQLPKALRTHITRFLTRTSRGYAFWAVLETPFSWFFCSVALSRGSSVLWVCVNSIWSGERG